MDKEKFIKLVKPEVSESAIESIVDNLIDHPERKPTSELMAQYEFYKSLPSERKEVINKIISEAVHEAVFGFLCVLDGVRSISKADELNNLELSHIRAAKKLVKLRAKRVFA